MLRFPFSTVHFSRLSAIITSLFSCVFGLTLACIPLLPAFSHWQFFSQTGICIPLPFVDTVSGFTYSFTVLILFNFFLVLMTILGQAVIYFTIQSSSGSELSSTQNKTSRDATVARRLLSVALSDFMCWFPIGKIIQ